MSDDEYIEKSKMQKRKQETETSDLNCSDIFVKSAKIFKCESIESLGKKACKNQQDASSVFTNDKRVIQEAIKTLDSIQKEINMDNIIRPESPETSDDDSSAEDEEFNRKMMQGAHVLGYTACIRETFRFLNNCGISENDPIFVHLKKRFLGSSENF